VSFKPPFPAPAFSAAALDGGTLGLAQFRGQHVLLNFWATWCPPCLEEMPSMDALYKHFKARNFVVLAISSDKEGASIVKAFIDKLRVSFPIALDPDGRIASVYGARNLPMSILVNPEGRVEAAAQGARDWASKEAFEIIDERLAPA
jgi:peroxiredoxin